MSEHAHTDQKAEKQQNPAQRQEPTTLESAALAGNPMYDTLQQGIGNRAVGRFVETQRAAANEKPTRVSPEQQRQIEDERSGGLPLEGAPGVRLHYGDNAQALSRGLNARAFTQGSDVFFGENYDANSEAGQATLAHELTHAARCDAMAGSVQRDGEDPRANKPAEVGTTATGEERYTLTLSDGIHDNLTKLQAFGVLNDVYQKQKRQLEMDKGEWDIVNKDRKTFIGMVGSTLVDIAGMDFPTYDVCWLEPEKNIEKVRLSLFDKDIKGAAELLKSTHETWLKGHNEWMKYKNQLDDAALKAQIGIVVVAVVAVMVVAAATTAAGGAVAVAGTEGGVGSGGLAGGTTAAGTEAGATTATAAGTETAATTTATTATETAATTATETATTATETATTATETAGNATNAGGELVGEVGVGGAHAAEVASGIETLQGTLTAGGEVAAQEAAAGYSVEVLEGMMSNLTAVANAGSKTAQAAAAANALYKIVEAAYKLKRGF